MEWLKDGAILITLMGEEGWPYYRNWGMKEMGGSLKDEGDNLLLLTMEKHLRVLFSYLKCGFWTGICRQGLLIINNNNYMIKFPLTYLSPVSHFYSP